MYVGLKGGAIVGYGPLLMCELAIAVHNEKG